MSNNDEKLKKAFGPLWDIYNNNKVYEIIIDAYDDVYYAEGSKLVSKDDCFRNSDEILEVASALIRYAGNEMKEGVFSYTFTINETTKVNIVLPPLSVKGPVINLYKIPDRTVTWDDLLKWEAIDEKGKDFIEDMLKNNKSIVVAGNIGSGKTTLTNLIVGSIHKDYRIVAIEKTAELVLNRKRTARLETINNQDHEMIELITIASRMRADYLVLNELQGPEVMSFVELLRDGASGIATLSAENIFDALKRLEFKAMSSNFGGSVEDIRYSISQAFDYIVFQERKNNGKRVVSRIGEIVFQDGELKLNIIYQK